MHYKMLATDLDNTLLRSDGSISPYTLSVLNALQKGGTFICFATARPERATHRFRNGFKPDAVVANNGATIWLNGVKVHEMLIDAATINALIAAFNEEQRISNYTLEIGDALLTTYHGEEWEPGWSPKYHLFTTPFTQGYPKISAECTDAKLLEKLLAPYPKVHLFTDTSSSWHQIMHEGASKINGLSSLCAQLGFSPSDVVAFGDDHSDIGMLRGCGLGVAMQNAIPEVLAAANEICSSNDEDGMAHWVAKHLL